MFARFALLASCAAALLAAAAGAAVYRVAPDGSGDFPDIALALQAAISGDVIELASGTFTGPGNRDLSFQGKSLTLRSQSGDPADCVLDALGDADTPRRLLRFDAGETVGARVLGITLRGGHVSDGAGGAVLCEESSPRIEGCIFVDNQAERGGALAIYGGAPELVDCRLLDNAASYSGGGMYVEDGATPRLENCRLLRNTAEYGGGLLCLESTPWLDGCVLARNAAAIKGGALYAGNMAQPDLSACTLAYNEAPAGSGIDAQIATLLDLERCLVVFGAGGAGLALDASSQAALVCSDLFGNAGGDWIGDLAAQLGEEGNLAADPLFCGEAGDDYGLRSDSPCRAEATGCGRMGAIDVLCGDSAVAPASWSAVKRLYPAGRGER